MAGSETATEFRSQRLSKPRTKSSRDLLKHIERNRESCSPISVADTYVFDDQITIVNSQSGNRRSRRTSRSRIRELLSGVVPHKSQSGVSFEDEGLKEWGEIRRGRNIRHSEIGGASDELLSSPLASSIQLSHYSNSKLYLPIKTSSSNHATNFSNSTSNSRILLPCDDNNLESKLVAMQIMEKAHADSITAQNHVPPPVDEDMHFDSVVSPIRRRSLYTPGIATRTPNDILRKPPPPKRALSKEDRDYYYNPNLSESSPLGRLAAMDLGNHGRSTPASLEYSHLGGLKPGTLRIMNGTTSPAPIDINPLRMHPFNSELLEHSCSSMDLEKVQRHDQSPRPLGFPFSTNCDLVFPASPLQADQKLEEGDWSQWRDDHFKPDAQSEGVDFNDEQKYEDGFVKQSIPDDASEISSDKKALTHYRYVSANLKDKTLSIAQSYIQELPTSPYADGGSSRQSSITLEHVSYKDPARYNSFDDEGIEISKSRQPVIDVWQSSSDDTKNRHDKGENTEDAIRKLTANAAPRLEATSRIEPAFAIPTDLHSSSNSKETFAAKLTYNTDSGYGSSDSLKSFMASALDDSMRSVNAASSFVSLPNTLRCDPVSETMFWSSQRSAENSLAQPFAMQSHLSSPPLVGGVSQIADHAPSAQLENLNDLNATLQPASASSPRRFAAVRKLQKSRPFSQQAPAQSLFVQSVRKPSQSTIPPVPSEIAARHSERIREFPLLEHTFSSSQDVKRDDGSPAEESIAVPIRFPSPTNTPDRRNSIIRSNLDWPTLKSKKSKSIKRGISSTTSKAQRRKSLGESPAALTNFGTENLGDNPYDIARFAADSRKQRVGHVSHPLIKDNLKPRPKSVIGMRKEVVVEVARSHSRHKRQNHSENCLESSTRLKDGAGAPVRLTRRRSMFADAPHFLPEQVPPIPVMPTKQQIAHWQARKPNSTEIGSNTLPPALQIDRTIENLKSPPQTRRVVVQQSEKKLDALEEWHSMRLCGDQRRKSEGDALIARFQALRVSNTLPPTVHPPIRTKEYIAYRKSCSLDVQNSSDTRIDIAPPHPSRQPPPVPSQENSFTSPQSSAYSGKRVAAATAMFEQSTGRYAGGLSYGYEPGYGLGGSAGTRNKVTTGAGKKSLHSSRGHGIDLADVPIFVSP